MELVTGAMESLVPKLEDLLKDEYGLQKGVREKIKSLSRELDVVHAVLRKIGDVPPDQLDEPVRLWVRDVREASYDMEDIVDAFLVDADGPEPTDPYMLTRLLKQVSKLFKRARLRRKISSLIQDINEKLEEVAARRGKYTVDNIVVKSVEATTAIDPRLQNLYKMVAGLVGIEGPRDDIINKLSLGRDVDVTDKKMKIVSIVGVGGLGKTTLAKTVYDHVKPHFECGAFVPVSRNPDMKKVFRDILIDLDKVKYTNLNMMVLDEKQLMDELKEFVKEKRCFIVIDDIWDKESWKLIRCAVQESNCGSRLVITTRISEVATHAGEVYKLQPLSRDDSEKLLYARIADGEGKYFDCPSAEACEKILKKCGGVPLAIITIASLLASKPGEDWSEVYSCIGFGHEDNDDVDNTRRILSFSYYDLPSHLKACLLYLSIFPEDYVIEKNSLIWKWIAEGFVYEEQATAAVGLFELGERYFNELINRNMIQPKETEDEGYIIDACSVHDMVLDLIHSLSSNENFVTVFYGNERQKHPGSIARRLALQGAVEHLGGQLDNIALEKVRSFFGSECEFSALCPRLQFLRVVDMERGCPVDHEEEEYCNEGVMDHLGSLLHLRYLGLAYTSFTVLPKEVGQLKFLQTLDLWRSYVKKLPEEVGLLTQLVCLRCSRGTRVPAGLLGKLTSLQELWIWSTPDFDDDSIVHFVKELGLLRELRMLWANIMSDGERTERELLNSLGNLHNIRTLHTHVTLVPMNRGSRHAELVSYRRLQYFYLRHLVLSELPAWVKPSLAPNLSYLDIEMAAVKEEDMETLARLPELRCLKLDLYGAKSVGIKVRHESGAVYFRKLRILRIVRSSIWFDLRGFECSSNMMPSLETLRFDINVRVLKDATNTQQLGLDRLLGFENLGTSSLQTVSIEMSCCRARMSEVEEVETALAHAAAVHPSRPTVRTTTQIHPTCLLTPYQEARMDVSRTPEVVIKAWKLSIDSGHVGALCLPDPTASSSKVIRLLYINNGRALLALSSNAIHKLWERVGQQSTESVPPQQWQKKEILMTNDTSSGNHEEATACIALSRNESYIISASGGEVSVFTTMNFQIMKTLMSPPPAATFLTFCPQDNNNIFIGMEDCSIQMYNFRTEEVEMVLMGHQKKITGLTFSQSKNVLVSSGADAQLCAWNMDGWEKKNSRYIHPPPTYHPGDLVGDTMVQFHYDQTHLLVVHESQLAIYDWNLDCLRSWFPSEALPAPVSCAVYSSDGFMIYAGFYDGAIGIFEADSLLIQCKIVNFAYIPSSISSGDGIVYPIAVAANTTKVNQIAVGMSDGAVHVLEPLDTYVQVDSNVSS